MQSAIVGSTLKTWLRIDLTHLQDGTVAKCVAFLAPFQSETTIFDTVKFLINRARTAVDQQTVTFYKREAHSLDLQPIDREKPSTKPLFARPKLEQFIAGKVYWLAFRAADRPGEIWIADPWDAEYLGVTVKDLSQSAYVLRARGLLELDSTLEIGRPADKLLTVGWPAAIESTTATTGSQNYTLSLLPRKEKLIEDLRSALSQPSDLALLVVDLDQFKQVNDTREHTEGDACLECVVKVIGDILGRKGTLYRWGGDEFAVLLPDFSTDEAYATAERIRRAILAASPGGDIMVTVSIGVCGSDRLDGRNAETILDLADKAMYASKRAGKNSVTCWPVA